MRFRILATISLALLSGACQGAYQNGTNTSASYGNNAARACADYGLRSGTAAYNQCVSREAEARSHRNAAAARPAYGTDQYGYRIDAQGYRVDANGYRIASQPQYSSQPGYPYNYQSTPRDAYGYRYDSQGNRLDANGHVITTQYRN
ncbi:MAG: hypothetical protein EPO67_07645 [Reyranella sp.]|nr:MAG: hypothetical protein EPO67_07645 [Reyranella sp.]